jgi:hypothetical protein
VDGYEIVYRLSDDGEIITRVQRATLDTGQFGIAMDHGLFGSKEWWEAIGRGDLSTYTVRGTICALLMESMNDWPTFTILAEDGFGGRPQAAISGAPAD